MSTRFTLLATLTIVATAACTTRNAARTSDTASPAAATVALASAPSPAAVRQQLDSIYARFSDAMLKGDTVALTNFYTDDAVLMPQGMPAANGRAEILKAWSAMHSQVKVTAFAGKTQSVLTGGDYAIETGTYTMASQPKTGKAVNETGKYLTVWQKQPDGSLKMVRDIFNTDEPMK
ncbi:MAG TPA: DUF4440 domain-containing protein [Gemmatimonadaceae bacterium]|nr:DUF4440 domain-containing protein [Gemmatimonadaceae bacterium]